MKTKHKSKKSEPLTDRLAAVRDQFSKDLRAEQKRWDLPLLTEETGKIVEKKP